VAGCASIRAGRLFWRYDQGFVLQVIEVDGVDLDDAGRVEKRFLWKRLEVSVELNRWDG
jgi:hypothetical protein